MGQESSAEEKAKLEAEFMSKAKSGFERMFYDRNPDELVTFVQRDARAREVADEIWQWMMEKHIEKDALAAEAESKRKCPCCGGVGKSREKERGHRDVIGERGPVGFEREGFYCGRCRKVFFPSRSEA